MGEVNMDYTLLSDSLMEASKAFGIAFRLDDETFSGYKITAWTLKSDPARIIIYCPQLPFSSLIVRAL